MCQEYSISKMTAKKYISMTEDEIKKLDFPNNYKTRKRSGNDFVNIIYKMMVDGYNDVTIYNYLRVYGITCPKRTILNYVKAISQENFPKRKRSPSFDYVEYKYPNDIIIIKRHELLKYILTTNSNITKNKVISTYLNIIKEKYPIITFIEETFYEFHNILKSNDSKRIDDYIKKYSNSQISSFCRSLERDISAVKNAVLYDISSGFVEGNNNKFKLIKRTAYGRNKITNLSKKCKLAFSIKKENFNISSLINTIKKDRQNKMSNGLFKTL